MDKVALTARQREIIHRALTMMLPDLELVTPMLRFCTPQELKDLRSAMRSPDSPPLGVLGVVANSEESFCAICHVRADWCKGHL